MLLEPEVDLSEDNDSSGQEVPESSSSTLPNSDQRVPQYGCIFKRLSRYIEET